jgi:hypothetical protein
VRLEAQKKMGFYSIPPEVMELLATHLAVPEKNKGQVTILDPCAGEGKAINQLVNAIGVEHTSVYICELEDGRAEECRKLMPEANVLGPGAASYHQAKLTPRSMSAIYCNPPFDDQLGGGGREEAKFFQLAMVQLVPEGVLIAVCPLATFKKDEILRLLNMHFHDIRIYRFPEKHRRFSEVVIICRKRGASLPPEACEVHGELYKSGWLGYYSYRLTMLHLNDVGDKYKPSTVHRVENSWGGGETTVVECDEEADVAVYNFPKAQRPRVWEKGGYTDSEKTRAILGSKLNKILESGKETVLDRPPMPPGHGHVAMLLASGNLDGIVPAGEDTHVVRGTSIKTTYESERRETFNEETGEITIKTIFSEKPELVVRAVDRNGNLHTLQDSTAKPEKVTDPGSVTVSVVDDDLMATEPTNKYGETQRAFPAPIESGGWKLACWTGNDTTPGYNSCVFATKAECDAYGSELSSRWFALRRHESHPTQDKANYKFENGKTTPI